MFEEMENLMNTNNVNADVFHKICIFSPIVLLT